MSKNTRLWAVLGYNDDGNIFLLQAVSRTALGAFSVIARRLAANEGVEFVAAWPWRAMSPELLVYPGDSVVSKETILEQPEVFK